MEILLKNYEVPTNIYIVGDYIEGVEPTILADDDEVTVNITDGERVNYLTTYGFVYIFSDEEFKNLLKSRNLASDGDPEVQYIRNYVGKITLNKIIDNKLCEFENELDLNDYINHQGSFDDGEDWCIKVDYGYSTNLWWNPFAMSAITDLFKN